MSNTQTLPGGQQSKRNTVTTIGEYLTNEGPVKEQVLLAEMELALGLSETKAEAYIEKMRTAGWIETDQNGLVQKTEKFE